MPSIPPTIEAALVTIKTDESAVLGLTLGTHKITPGFHIPKAGKQFPVPFSYAMQAGNEG